MHKKQKQILIVGWKTGENSFGVTVPYLEYFSKFGQVHVLTPNNIPYVYRADLLVLPGGRDVNPTRYNQRPGYHTGHPEPILEYFDTKILPMYIEKNIPIFGICRGHQTLAVHFGLNLIQHLLYHETTPSHTRDKEVHKVFSPSDYNFDVNKFRKNSEKFSVNSLHHQAIGWNEFVKTDELIPTLVSDDYCVEAMIHKTLPIASVQWHPEELEDDYSKEQIDLLLEWKKK